MKLSDYDMSASCGFLSHFEIVDIDLPDIFVPVLQAADNLSGLMTTGRVRHWLEQLPALDLAEWASNAPEEQVRVAMVRYSFLVQAYVWGESEAPTSLPANLARPMVALADRLDQAPLLPYSGYVLDNWARLDRDSPIGLDNVYMVQNFLGGADENWFVLIHVVIEAEAGPLLGLACDLVEAAFTKDTARATALLEEMDGHWDAVNAIFDRMPDRCDPYIYYQRVRPYIHGWANNPALPDGLIYEGVGKYKGKGQLFRGQTGSQSSIVPSMDALFQVRHENDPLRVYLDELHAYRPVQHRRYIEDLREQSTLREFAIASGDAALRKAFNASIEQVARFRTRHLEYAASYINKQAASGKGNDTEVGTGGTPFMKYLKKHRDENRAQVI
ncbi:indoleamine 2,3-dioxygenase [Parasphingorhabdus sp.]|uniref:indoleamine 2,3-dioxygenase n=1 Tax=Parasphingorhabdus sp. TaxID=2709688 RepID=UPI0030AD51FE|nr:indoleamine 2,3-dioxygenase [Sphingomonadales bacterium]